MNILKFGGTSMGDEQTWHRVLGIISRYDAPVVVVSATARTTRRLLAAAEAARRDLKEAYNISQSIRERHKNLILNFMANYRVQTTRDPEQACLRWINQRIDALENHLKQISKTGQISPVRKDAIASLGEQLSSYLFAQCGKVFGLNTQWIDARQVIKTDSEFGKANPDTKAILCSVIRLSDAVDKKQIPVIGGYYGESHKGKITTLGFEGSDFTASLIGSALNVGTIEIWTDVSGIFTCDPRLIPGAQSIRELSFTEATELAYFGAKILHPSTMKPAARKHIPILVKNIFEPDHPGTRIHTQAKAEGPAKAITFIEDIVIVTVSSAHTYMGYQFLSEVFASLKTMHIPVDVVTTTEASVSLALETSPMAMKASDSLKRLGKITLTEQQALISIIGCAFPDTDTITQKVLNPISGSQVSMISYSRAKQNLNLVLPREHMISSVKAIHSALFPVNQV